MEMKSYQSAPTSPNHGMEFFHTAPSSPTKDVPGDTDTFASDFEKSNFDDEFEFSTSRRFGDYIELEIRENLEYFLEDDEAQNQQQGKVKRERGGSLPTMAFADELFYNGLVMPLKPPPRLQNRQEDRSFSLGSVPSSPRSSPHHITGFIKVPFIHHKAAWNDDFDPFKVALKKVSEDSRGRSSVNGGIKHRRTRSHSPFRTNNSGIWNDQHEEKMDDQKNLEQKYGLPKEPKGSPYSRFVIDQKKQVEEMAKEQKKPQKIQSGRRIRPVKTEHKQNGVIEENNNIFGESGMKRIKSILLKYASFGRENNEEKTSNNQSFALWKSSYFKKLSFKIKGNNDASGNVKKRGIEEEEQEPKMQVVEYKRNKPPLALCLGYGFEDHKSTDYSL